MGLIYLDSSILIDALEHKGERGRQTRASLVAETEHEFVYSPLVKLECLVAPVRSADIAAQQRYETAFAALRSLTMNEAVFEAATHLRARHGLKTPDALHLAAAQVHDCVALWTNDYRLATASRGLAVNVLE